MRRVLTPALLAVAVLSADMPAGVAHAQTISLDQGVRAGGLWCFPVATNPLEWVYLPAGAKLAPDEAGRPQFSFVRYVSNRPSDQAGPATLTTAMGGGVLHFLVELATPKTAIDAAQEELRRSKKEDKLRLAGPLVFKEGSYALVSSILSRSGKPNRKELLATGRAPVLEGNRLAFSFDLEPEGATLLLESLKMPTPDVSLVFDMTFSGWTDAYQAKLILDWSEVRKSEAFSAGASLYFVGADVESVIEELRRKNAIRLETAGNDANMEGLLSTVYTRLLELMFRPVQIEKVPEEQRGGLEDAFSALTDPRNGALSSRNTTGFGLYAGYQAKDIQSSGTTVLDFNHRASVDRHSFITFNLGDLYRRHGQDERYFRAVNLEDPTFEQREIHVGIDGALLPELGSFVNSVTVTLRKTHGNGEQTLRELVLDRGSIEKGSGDLRMVYGSRGDTDRTAWLSYEARTRWSFKGGGSFQTEWQAQEAAMLDLYTPYERRRVALSGDPERLTSLGVRAVVVEISYPFFGATRREQRVLRAGQNPGDESFEITLPRETFEYDYQITWQLAEGRRITHRGRDGSGLIFVDELPGS